MSDRLATVRWGTRTRIDDVELLGLYRTQARERRDALRVDAVDERSIGAFGELEVNLTDRLRAIAGFRGDYYDWDVQALRADNEVTNDDTIYSPKLSFAYRFTDSVEGYANWARVMRFLVQSSQPRH